MPQPTSTPRAPAPTVALPPCSCGQPHPAQNGGRFIGTHLDEDGDLDLWNCAACGSTRAVAVDPCGADGCPTCAGEATAVLTGKVCGVSPPGDVAGFDCTLEARHAGMHVHERAGAFVMGWRQRPSDVRGVSA